MAPMLLLFDVDGTLVSTGGAGSNAMALALEEMYGTSDGLMDLHMAGKTDPIIFREAVAALELPARGGDLPRFQDRYFKHLSRLIGTMPGGRILPGVVDLLRAGHDSAGVHLGLLTGNWREGARLKLSGFGLWQWFELGAFADDSEVRDELLPFALDRMKALYGAMPDPANVVIVGDTPSDIRCARPYGARTLAVATGPYTVEQLSRHNPDLVLSRLPGAKTLQLLGVA